MTDYRTVHARSLADPEGFWAEAAAAISWDQRWSRVCNFDNPPFVRWFEGAKLNTCYNCVDRHIEAGHGDRIALIYDSPMTGTKHRYCYLELRDLVATFAGAMKRLGVVTGDRVIIYMPMVPEAVIAMLACARLGAIHSVVFGGFAAHELAKRIDDATPKLIVSASCGLEPGRTVHYKPLLDDAIAQARHKPDRSIILQRPESEAALDPARDSSWAEAIEGAEPQACVSLEATHPLYILYTSGTTGQPKGIVRDNGGHAVALAWSMRHIYGIRPGEVFWAASDVGWVVGHSYIVYAPLLNGSTTVLFEGKPVGTPDAGVFWRVIAEHDVRTLFTAPTAIRAIKKEDPKGEHLKRYSIDGFRALFLAGERCDPDTLVWSGDMLGVPVIDHWWQTETGWAICSNYLGIELLPVKPGSPTLPAPGYDVRILDEGGHEMPVGAIGAIAVKLPLPPSCMPTLWQNDGRFKQAYMSRYPGFYLTGDAGYHDEDGYLFVMSRIDDVINVAGHRLSTGSIEEVLASHGDVAECAVIGAGDDHKGAVPMGMVVLKAGVARDHQEICKELVQKVREDVGPVAAFKCVTVVKRLPKTRSGKILRGTMKNIADSAPYTMPATIDDPAILDEIAHSLRTIGYAK